MALFIQAVLVASSDGAFIPDTGFEPNFTSKGEGSVSYLIPSGNGRFLVDGGFVTVDGASRGPLVMLKADGTVDGSFNPAFVSGKGVSAVAETADGKVYVAGFTDSKYFFVRLNADGTVDSAFDPQSVADPIYLVSAAPDGGVWVASSHTDSSGSKSYSLNKLKADGTSDTSLLPGSIYNLNIRQINDLAVQPDGKLLVAGNIISNGSPGLIRLNTDGTVDTTFAIATGTAGMVQKISVNTDGSVIAAGTFSVYRDQATTGCVQLASDGTVASAPDLGATSTDVKALAAASDGGVWIAETAAVAGSSTAVPYLKHISGTSNTVDISIPLTAYYSPAALALTANGDVILGGSGRIGYSADPAALVEVAQDGASISPFGPSLDGGAWVNCIFPAPDGSVYYGGSFTAVNGIPCSGLVHLFAGGKVDTSFRPVLGGKEIVDTIVAGPGGDLLVGGSFDSVNGASCPDLAMLKTDGSLENGFAAAPDLGMEVMAIIRQSDGKILCGGIPTAGSPLVRLAADGSIDSSFASPISAGSVSALAAQSDGKIVVGGYFTVTSGGSTVSNFLRLNVDGTLDTSLAAANGANARVETITQLSDDSLVVGGAFTSIAGQSDRYLAKLNADGSFNASFSQNLGTAPNSRVDRLAVESDGSLLVAGRFTSAGGVDNAVVFHLAADGTVDSGFTPGLEGIPFGVGQDSAGNILICGSISTGSSSDSFGVVKLVSRDFALSTISNDQILAAGQAALLSVSVSGPGPFTYQWKKDGATLAGQTGSTLALTNFSADLAGSYSVVVTEAGVSVASDPIFVEAQTAPAITAEPQDAATYVSGSVIFSVAASGAPSPTYQWKLNGTPIAGATGNSVILNNLKSTENGDTISVVVSNAAGSSTSRDALLTVEDWHGGPAEYFGHFGSGSSEGTFALYLRSNNTAVLLGYLADGHVAFMSMNVEIDPVSGAFFYSGGETRQSTGSDQIMEAAPANLQLQGTIGPDGVRGSISSLDIGFSGTESANSGSSSNYSGFYQAAETGAPYGEMYVISGGDGTVYALSLDTSRIAAGVGTIGSDGTFSVTISDGSTLNGSVDSSVGSIEGSETLASGTEIPIVGVQEGQAGNDYLVNISTRGYVGTTGQDSMIAGFVINGTQPKKVLIRAVGPGLDSLGVSDYLTNPQISVFHNGTVIDSDDDWGDNGAAADVSALEQKVGAFDLDSGSKDAALVTTLDPGIYTAQVTGAAGQSGVVLVEVYDASDDLSALGENRLVNLSSRGLVESGEKAMIAGFVVTGNVPKKVLIRAVGEELNRQGVQDFLANPKLRVMLGSTEIRSNDDWDVVQDPGTVASAASTVGAFPLDPGSKSAAVLTYLDPGAYTVIVSSADSSSGVALVEVYEVPQQ